MKTQENALRSDVYCVIMAGGIGSRFWPLSRENKPKQFLDILGTGKSLIQQTFERVTDFCLPQNVFIVTGTQYRDEVKKHLPAIEDRQILLEPMRRNTAPCIAFANKVIKELNPNAIIIVAPSDHLVLDRPSFLNTINQGIEFVSANNALLTIGIKPSRPETGYGYIQVAGDSVQPNSSLFKVKTFTEKPNQELAKVFVDSGEFYWNSGIFIWSLSSIDKAFQGYLPEIYNLFEELPKDYPSKYSEVEGIYTECQNISIDYGVLEKAENVFVICSEFGWSDLGTWGSLYQNSEKDCHSNAIGNSNILTYNVTNSIINLPEGKLAVIQGLDGYIVVESEGVLLISKLEDEQEIRKYQNDVLVEKGEGYT